MTVDRKANDFSKVSDFTITIAIATCGSLCVYALSTSTSFMPCPLRLRLLCLGESSAPSASSMARSVYVYYLYLVHFVGICCTSVSRLLVCVFYSLLRLRLLSVPLLHCLMSRLLHLCLLYLGELSAPSTSSMAYSVCICCLYLVHSVCICYALVSYLLVCIFYSSLHLRLLSMPLLHCLVPRLLRSRLLCLDESSAPSASSVTHSVCVCCASISHLLRLRLLFVPRLLRLYPQFYHFRCKLHGITVI